MNTYQLRKWNDRQENFFVWENELESHDRDNSTLLEVIDRETNLVPITGDEAMDIYRRSGRVPFSFVMGPYGITKTIMTDGVNVTAAPPWRAMAHYSRHGFRRGRRRA
jgi:hypothetical protein